MNANIYVDLDGTILDVWPRYFQIVADFFHLPNSMFDSYKQLKLSLCDDRQVIPKLVNRPIVSNTFHTYNIFKHKNLESPEYLTLDSLLISKENLKYLTDLYHLQILTIRKNKNALLRQYQLLDIAYSADNTTVLTPNGMYTKLNWLRSIIVNNKNNIVMIGDSETDIIVGTLAQCKTIFVQTGLRSLDHLGADIRPDIICKNIQEAFEILPSIFNFI